MNKIFLIDDDEDDQLLFTDAMQLINPLVQCETAPNGKIGLHKLKTSATLPDIIFLDLNMPVMNGFEFLQQIKNEKHLLNIPVGIFTTSNMMDDMERTKELGARFFITKPDEFNALCTKLQEVLNTNFRTQKFAAIEHGAATKNSQE
jgi:CheY-like chemotaxis protein